MKYRLVIFDFDGTLADTFTWFTGRMDELGRRFDFRKVEPEEYETLRHCDVRQILERLGVPIWKTPLIAHELRLLMERDAGHIPLFTGVDRLLERLRDQGMSLGVVSSNSCRNIRRILGPANAARIDHYECGVSLFGKTDRLRAVLRHSGVPAAQAIYIGDEIRDLEAARRAQVAFGAVSWGYNHVEALRAYGPDEVFDSFEEIGSWGPS